jgi:hypothetical protein
VRAALAGAAGVPAAPQSPAGGCGAPPARELGQGPWPRGRGEPVPVTTGWPARAVRTRGPAMPAGAGFTGSLLIGGSAYAGTDRFERVTTAVPNPSVLASAPAAAVFRVRMRQRVRGGGETGATG